MSDDDPVEVIERDDGTYKLVHEGTGIIARAPTEGQAREYLEEGLKMYASNPGRRISDEELEELDIDPAEIDDDADQGPVMPWNEFDDESEATE